MVNRRHAVLRSRVGRGLIVVLWLVVSTACQTSAPAPTATPVATAEAPEPQLALGDVLDANLGQLGDVVILTPTPAPTATPGFVENMVEDVTTATGMGNVAFLGLTASDWINLVISLLYIGVVILVLIPLAFYGLRLLFKRVRSQQAEALLRAIQGQIRWLVALLITQYALTRLDFIPATLKAALNQLYFTIYVILIATAIWRLIERGLSLYKQRMVDEKERSQIDALLPGVRRGIQAIIILTVGTILLNTYGVNVTLPVLVLGLLGFALSIAARDTLTDVFDGIIILLDKPFRVGDRIEIQDLGQWGDVVEIGARTTRIRTRDNRLVIVPNSKIGRSQVVNYTYPDPRYRIEALVGISYDSDIERARRLMIETVQGVEGVLPDRPVQALLDELGESTLQFRVRWWSHSYADTRYVRDRVLTALYTALSEAGIEMPFTTYDINLNLAKSPSTQCEGYQWDNTAPAHHNDTPDEE